MLKNIFRTRPKAHIGDVLYGAAVEQARHPGFYTTLNVTDRIDARFELYTLHILVLILRLRDEPGDDVTRGAEAAQSLFDVYVSALDNALRELGVGDISMARKMRNLGEALYGRMVAYEAPIRAGDAEALAEHLTKNVYENDADRDGLALARYALSARQGLASQSLDAILRQPQWPEIAR